MYQFSISSSTVCECPHLPSLLEGIEDKKKQGVRVYEFAVDNTQTPYVFRTTSKEVFLKLGALGFELQHLLAKLLEWSYDLHRDPEMLLYVEGEKNALMVTRTIQAGGSHIYTCAPAYSLRDE